MIEEIISALSAGIAISVDSFILCTCEAIQHKSESRRARFSKLYPLPLMLSIMAMLFLLLGYFVGSSLYTTFDKYDHFVAFALLGAIAFHYFNDARPHKKSATESESSHSKACPTPSRHLWIHFLLLSLVASIDAMALGFGIYKSLQELSIWGFTIIIGMVSWLLSVAGCFMLRTPSNRILSWARVVAGIVLLAIGFKIMWEHGVFN